LTAALVLRHHGVETVVVEQRTTTSPQPKARRLHVRSMEVFRQLGLAGVVREAARDLAGHDHMAAGRTLAECAQLPLFAGAASVDVSPELPCLIAQDVLEPVLCDAARDAGADVRFGTALTGFDGTTARLGEETLQPAYVIAADGARSPLRDRLGISRSGPGPVGAASVNVYFRADLGALVRGREFNLCQIEHPDAPGAVASVDGRVRWVFMTRGGPDQDWETLLRTAIGVAVPDLEVLSVLPWRPESLVADRFAAGRVYLAGDAAHVMPPWAAMGANTGIADVHDLGWMLAAVLRGGADPELLAAYDAERRPAATFVADQSTRRTQGLRERNAAPDPTLADPFVLATGGFQYLTGAVRHGAPDPEPVTTFAPAARVGTRIPHRWLPDGRSTLDLAAPDWAVLTGSPAQAQGLRTHHVEADFLGPDECLLLRPDHVVAWRGVDPAAAACVRCSIVRR
jgi:2-polyprenyl-6-methoxyphenol hydroxylase-like FAD-dependent oxidoreductase